MSYALCRHLALVLLAAGSGVHAQQPGAVRVLDLLPERSMTRVGKAVAITATIANAGAEVRELQVALRCPDGLRIVEAPAEDLPLAAGEERDLRWVVEADRPLRDDVRVTVDEGGARLAEGSATMRFLPAIQGPAPGYLPEPRPAPTELLIGAHHCPLWEAEKPTMWAQIRKHMDRVPALGFYDGANPEVADWETTWAVEHGVTFFIYCWYRTSQGGPVTTMFESAITKALQKSRYRSQMRYTIMWENQSRGRAGVADERDLMDNLLPYWIETFFKDPSYLKVDNKPVLFIYRPEFLVDDLGGVDQVVQAFDRMRAACREAGFDGLTLLGEYRGLDPNHLALMKSLGLDYTFAYCWHVGGSPAPDVAVATQMDYIRKTQELDVLPQVVTVTQGWSGWADEGSIWKLPAKDWEGLLRQAKAFVSTLPADQLGSRMLLLDNWNEWGEGHYLSPHVDNGFDYLDAVRRVFSTAPEEHTDLIPEDLGLEPYDTAYRAWVAAERETRRELAQFALKPGAEDPGLLGWWAFDEPDGAAIALDVSGNRRGGRIAGGAAGGASRAEGRDGSALVCDGRSATVSPCDDLNPGGALTIECWVRTERAGQPNNWLVNRVYQSGDTGYRLGVVDGKPCFEVPETSWSHHLSASEDLPTGRWVHLAGTFDGTTMRIYVDGREQGSMERPGPVKANAYPLTLGSYEAGHQAAFAGSLDEVRLYRRALTAEEIAARARQ